MLPQTFCHIPGIGATKEARLWAAGVHSWDHAAPAQLNGPLLRHQSFRHAIEQSRHELAHGNADFYQTATQQAENRQQA